MRTFSHINECNVHIKCSHTECESAATTALTTNWFTQFICDEHAAMEHYISLTNGLDEENISPVNIQLIQVDFLLKE